MNKQELIKTEIWDQVYKQVDDRVEKKFRYKGSEKVWTQVNNKLGEIIWDQIRNQVIRRIINQAKIPFCRAIIGTNNSK